MTAEPNGCQHCGIPKAAPHARQWTEAAGWHPWTEPTDGQIRDRMLTRRNTPKEHRVTNVIPLADQLREAAAALAALAPQAIATTDDPLTLLRCLHATTEALLEIAPAALTAARLNPEAITSDDAAVADIHDRVTRGLGAVASALHDACNSV